MPDRTTELIARETLAGLAQQVHDLTAPENDGDERPWQMAEDKAREMVAVCETVSRAIIARSMQPCPVLHPIFAQLLKQQVAG